jgi:hypothetical protein
MLNYCRLFLGVTTISDVTTADGKDIDRTMFLGTPSLLANQDDATSFDDLAVKSQLNVRADTLAKEYNSVSHHKASAVP